MNVLTELEAAWRRTDAIFSLLADDDALFERPLPLRHPPIFYVGHLPAFAWNHLGVGVLGEEPMDARLDELFARGIDPHDEEEAERVAIPREEWPTPDQTRAYRDTVRDRVRALAPRLALLDGDELADGDRVLHMIVEHEQMHHETLIYMLKRMRPERMTPVPTLCGDEDACCDRDPLEVPLRLPVPAGTAHVGADFHTVAFGWDNEFPAAPTPVETFELDALPVTVARYKTFVEATGAEMPIDWIQADEGLRMKTLHGSVPMEDALAWPVHVTRVQAQAFADHVGGRIPTEAELYRAAFGDGGAAPWGDASCEGRGNFGWRRLGPAAVGSYPRGKGPFGHEELIGNGWEWTSTPFGPLPGFEAWIRTYPGYSADFFDGDHYIVFGAAWPTADRLLRRSFRNWFFEHYPHAFSTFRLAW